jgi:type IV secretory pathway protease TraF
LFNRFIGQLETSEQNKVWWWIKPVFFDELVGFIPVSRVYFGATNLGLLIRFNPLSKVFLGFAEQQSVRFSKRLALPRVTILLS